MQFIRTFNFSNSRRTFIKQFGAGLTLTAVGGSLLTGCSKKEAPLRIATNVFPGYELLHLAAAREYFHESVIRMVSVPSATACLQALASGSVEGGALTLDEVISAYADHIPLKIVAVLDVSSGADVLLARVPIKSLAELKGKRVGVEQTAVGAVMLAAALEQANLSASDVNIIYATVDQHVDLFNQQKVDALVTFEPVSSQLVEQGAINLFDSRKVPGLIVDVLVVRPEVARHNPHAIRQLILGQHRALKDLQQSPELVAPILARRLNVPAHDVLQTFKCLEFPDVASNRIWLEGDSPKIDEIIQKLQKLMLRSRLLIREVRTSHEEIVDSSFLPVNNI